jgi:hypothetical protein
LTVSTYSDDQKKNLGTRQPRSKSGQYAGPQLTRDCIAPSKAPLAFASPSMFLRHAFHSAKC